MVLSVFVYDEVKVADVMPAVKTVKSAAPAQRFFAISIPRTSQVSPVFKANAPNGATRARALPKAPARAGVF